MELKAYLEDAQSDLDTAIVSLGQAADRARSGNDSTRPRRLRELVSKLMRIQDELEGEVSRVLMGE